MLKILIWTLFLGPNTVFLEHYFGQEESSRISCQNVIFAFFPCHDVAGCVMAYFGQS